MRELRESIVSRDELGLYHVRCIASGFLHWLFQSDPQQLCSGCPIEQALRDARVERRTRRRLTRRERQELQRRLAAGEAPGLAEGEARVKDAILKRLDQLCAAYPIRVEHFSIMDNHLHLVLRVDPEVAWLAAPSGFAADMVDNVLEASLAAANALEVATRWLTLHPGDARLKGDPEALRARIEEKAADVDWVEQRRLRLRDLSWFMKDFAQIVAQDFNRATGRRGPLWAGRYRCDRVDGLAANVAVAIYVELNPLRAGLCRRPEDGRCTSLEARLHHRGQSGLVPRTSDCVSPRQREAAAASRAVRCGLSRGFLPAFGDEDPEEAYVAAVAEADRLNRGGQISAGEFEEARRAAASSFHGARRGGALSWIPWERWLKLVDRAARVLKDEKAALAADEAAILERLGEFVTEELVLLEEREFAAVC